MPAMCRFRRRVGLCLCLFVGVFDEAMSQSSERSPLETLATGRSFGRIGQDRPAASVGRNRPMAPIGHRVFAPLGRDRPFGISSDRPFGTIGSGRPFGGADDLAERIAGVERVEFPDRPGSAGWRRFRSVWYEPWPKPESTSRFEVLPVELPHHGSASIRSPIRLPSIEAPPLTLEPMDGERRGFGQQLEEAAQFALWMHHHSHARSLMRTFPRELRSETAGWLETVASAAAGCYADAAEALRASTVSRHRLPPRPELVPPTALRSLEEHLRDRPDDEDALLVDAALRAVIGDFAVLELDLRTLRQLNPDEPRLAELEQRAIDLIRR